MWYVLNGKKVVQVDEDQWKDWFVANVHKLVLARQEILDQGIVVTTVFVGIPLTLSLSSPSDFFLTRIEGGNGQVKGRTYKTFNDAMQGHLEICSEVMAL